MCASTLSFCFAKRSVLSEAGQVGCVVITVIILLLCCSSKRLEAEEVGCVVITVIILLLCCSSKQLEAEEVGCVPNISYVTWFPNILTNTKFPSNDCTTNYHATLNKPSKQTEAHLFLYVTFFCNHGTFPSFVNRAGHELQTHIGVCVCVCVCVCKGWGWGWRGVTIKPS